MRRAVVSWQYDEYSERWGEVTISAHEPRGADWSQLQQGLNYALKMYREKHRISDATIIADDAIRIHPRDDAIVIRFRLPE
jgi:hypothetical protein